VLSAVILTVVGMLWNVSDRRNAVMVQIETYLDRMLPKAGAGTGVAHSPAALDSAMARLDAAVARFESALHGFASTTGEFHDFNAHLKDNVQRLSLAFGDMSTTLKEQLGPLRHGGRG
jgi:hypothetical protein